MATETGSIDARLTLDTDPFDRAADRAEARARELGAMSPTVNVDANVGRALTDLAAVDAAERRVGSSSVDMGKQGRTGILALVAAAPAAVAALGPIGAAAIGLGASFGVMAVSGVLAIKGIKDAMAEGTRTGDQYTVGLGSMEGMLDQLSHSAAVGMLGAFNGAVQDLSARMPFLNRMIYDASGQLGTLGGTALHGVLDAMQALNPLITAGGVELNKFVGWLAAMPASNGFSQFVDYAITNLPSVMNLIEGLVTTVGRIIQAFAPLGPVVVGALQVFTDVVNNLPLPVLAGLVTTVASLNIALRLAGSPIVAGGIRAVSTALVGMGMSADLAVPVVGILLAALTGLAVGLGSAAMSGSQATQVVADYTDALREDNDALGVNVRATAAKALQDAGAFDAATKLGISQNILTNAVLGSAGAQAKVTAQVALAQSQVDGATNANRAMAGSTIGLTNSSQDLVGAISTVTGAIGTNQGQIHNAIAASKNMKAALDDQNGSTNALATSMGMTGAEYQTAVGVQKQAADQLAQTTANMQLQNDAAGLLKAAWDQLNGKTMAAAQANIAFDSTLANMGDHVSATGKKITFTTTSIKDQSSASVALRQQLYGQVQAMQNVVEANGGLDNSTGKARGEYEKLRQRIIDNAVAHGVEKQAVIQMIDTWYKVPKVVVTKAEAQTAQAMADAQALQAYINSMHGTTLTNRIYSIYSENHVSTGQGGSGGQTRADGGPIYRADGGPVYLASGGFSHGPIGTDTVRAYLTPGEYVMKRASAQSIGAPAMNYMNSTGKLPPTSGGAPIVHVYIDGKEMRSDMVQIAVQQSNNAIDSFARDIRNRR